MLETAILIPIKDEKDSLPQLFKEIQDLFDLNPTLLPAEVLVIDDGSRDGSWVALEEHKNIYDWLKPYKFQFNQGKALALDFGFQESNSKYVVTMDGDLQDQPKEIPEMIEMLKNGKDLISGWKKIRHDPWHKTLPSKLFNIVTSLVAGHRLHDFNCGLKAYKRDVVKSIRLQGDFHRFIPVLAVWKGFEIDEKIVEHRSRQHGVSKYGISRLLSGFLDLITLLFLQKYSQKPLHLFGLVGVLFSVFGLGVFGYFFVEWLMIGETHLRPLMVMAGVSFIIGLQFISLGLLGEMLNNRTAEAGRPIVDKMS